MTTPPLSYAERNAIPAAGHLDVSLPARWRRRHDPDRGILVAARAPTVGAQGVHPEMVLRCAPVVGDLVGWRARALDQLARTLLDVEVEDEEVYELEGQQVAYCRFAHRLGLADVLCDQWSWLCSGLGLTLTCLVAREDYADYCELFEAVASTVAVVPRAA